MSDRIKHNLLIPPIFVLFITLSLFLQPVSELLNGFWLIQINESILLTDYISIGGIGPALLNSGLLMMISYIFVRKQGLHITGSIFAGILTIGGFAFFGKNIINVIIIYLGVLAYAKYRKISIKSVVVVFLFSTGLSPISSVVMFGLDLPFLISIPLGIATGFLAGFLLVELSSRVITFHKGYDLYNVGFASGILSFAFFSVFRLFDLDYETNLIYNNDSHLLLNNLFILICLSFVVIGFVLNGNQFTGYKAILKETGRAVTDFTRRDQQAVTMINIGLTGLMALLMLMILDVHMNGPVFGGLFTIIGFSAFGKHIRNTLPPMIGVVLISLIFDLPLSVPVVLAVIFSTGLAPIAGEFGFVIGIVAGMLHLPVALSLSQLHGGILLYSNGFAAAFTAVIITTCITSFKRGNQ